MDDMRQDQALAIVAALIEAKPAMRVLEGWVGYGNVPDPKDFLEVVGQLEVARWRELLSVIGNATDLLRASVDEREVQTEFAVAEGPKAS